MHSHTGKKSPEPESVAPAHWWLPWKQPHSPLDLKISPSDRSHSRNAPDQRAETLIRDCVSFISGSLVPCSVPQYIELKLNLVGRTLQFNFLGQKFSASGELGHHLLPGQYRASFGLRPWAHHIIKPSQTNIGTQTILDDEKHKSSDDQMYRVDFVCILIQTN